LKVKWDLLKTGRKKLTDLPMIRDPEIEAAIRILVTVGSAVIFIPYLFPLMVCKAFSLLLKHGNTIYSGHICCGYGMLIIKATGNIKEGYEWGKTALELSEKYETNSVKCSTRFLVNSFFLHWREHLKDSLEPLFENYWNGLENGNIEFTSYSALHYSQNAFFSGRNLRRITEENQTFYERFPSLRNEYAFRMHNISHQAVLNLIEETDSPWILTGRLNDEGKLIEHYLAVEGKRELFKIYLYKIMLSYLFESYEKAHDSCVSAESYLENAFWNSEIVVFRFYYILSKIAITNRYAGVEKKRIFKQINKSIQIFRRFARLAPMNCSHKLSLIEAEWNRVTGNVVLARSLYDDAIAKAKENDYPNDLALSLELAGKFLLSLNSDDESRAYITEAYRQYQSWSARNKLRFMEHKYFYLLADWGGKRNMTDKTVSKKSNGRQHQDNSSKKPFDLDMQTVMKAAAAISSELQLESLLKKLMRIAVENSGAEKGYLVLKKDDAFYIEAEGSVNTDEEVILLSIPLKGNSLLPEKLVQFVCSTKENLVVGDAREHPLFSNDPIIMNLNSKSILCMPVFHQAEIIGLLYFENSLITDAFTEERIEILKLLSGQMAISLQNAMNEEKKMKAMSDKAKLIEQINLHNQELLKTKLEIQEQTFQSISQEIHDNIGQTLSLIKLNIHDVGQHVPEEIVQKVNESKNLLSIVIQDLRDLSKSLNTDFISEVQLEIAISQQLSLLERTGIYQTSLERKGNPFELSTQNKLVIFRVVQELLNNIVKHAEATSIQVSIEYKWNSILFTITDNGKGFNFEKQRSITNAGLGLRNILSRIELIKGNIRFESEERKGTTVVMEVPELSGQP
jgi:histidine kinase